MIEIKFPSDNLPLAAAIGAALLNYGRGVENRETDLPAVVPAPVLTDYDNQETHVELDDSADEELAAKQEAARQLEAEQKAKAEAEAKAAAEAQQQTTAPAPDAPKDQRGVPHNAQMCVGLKADKPFYATGKQAGGWKKGRGVDEAAFNAWYEGELAKVQADTPATENQPDPEPAANTAAAFGAQQQQTAVEPPPAATGGASQFKDAGHFMQWLSENQAAGRISQQDVEAAYADTRVEVPTLFNPATAAEAIAKVYDHLCANVEGLQ